MQLYQVYGGRPLEFTWSRYSTNGDKLKRPCLTLLGHILKGARC